MSFSRSKFMSHSSLSMLSMQSNNEYQILINSKSTQPKSYYVLVISNLTMKNTRPTPDMSFSMVTETVPC